MENISNNSVGDIVRLNFKTAQLFERNNIDFCCGGEISLSEACEKSNVDINKLMPEIEALMQVSDPDSKYIEGLPLDALCDYIVKRHHSYVNETIPFLQQKLDKLCDVHGQAHSELFQIKALFDEAAGNLTMHMIKEELILFPHIEKMVKHKNAGSNDPLKSGDVQNPIKQMEHEHEIEGERFRKIAGLTNQYTMPSDGCNTYSVSYQTLGEFEQDLHRHIHIENNILFKKALELEIELAGRG